jgi:hypothetical protein
MGRNVHGLFLGTFWTMNWVPSKYQSYVTTVPMKK